jgi:hypothetical protein
MRYNRAIVALMTRLKAQGRLKPKQIVVAAMRKLLVLCFGVLKTGKPIRSGDSDGLLSHIMASIAWRALVGGGGGGQAPKPEGAGQRGLDARLRVQHPFMRAVDAFTRKADQKFP